MAQIIWHDSAREHLRSIFDYYSNLSPQTAYNILKDILISVQHLAEFPTMGQEEPLLKLRPYKYHYIVSRKRYKTIYFIKGDECHIIAIWDTYQNPTKLQTIISEA